MNALKLGVIGVVLALVAGGCAFYILGWVIVVWTFGVNPLWGVIAAVVWLALGYLGQIANKSRS